MSCTIWFFWTIAFAALWAFLPNITRAYRRLNFTVRMSLFGYVRCRVLEFTPGWLAIHNWRCVFIRWQSVFFLKHSHMTISLAKMEIGRVSLAATKLSVLVMLGVSFTP
jgi:hypothetical protein